MTSGAAKAFRFAGHSLKELAAIAGGTPAYVYDHETVEQRIALLRQQLPDCLDVHYSLKANSLAQWVQRIAPLVDGLDVTSHSELRTALGTATSTERISFSGPGKREAELMAAVSAGITIHLESAGELERIAKISNQLSKEPRLSVRINPDFKVKQSGMVMSGGAQPFGIDSDQIETVVQTIRQLGFSVQGFHCYAGSQILSADVLIELQGKTLDLMSSLAQRLKIENPDFNIGGGFGIPYFEKEQSLGVQAVGDALAQRLQHTEKELGTCKVNLELGRYIVGEAGIYIATVVDRKVSHGKHFIVVDGGLNHHLAATGNLGQVFRKNYPVASSSISDSIETVNIVGPLCTPLDVLAEAVSLPHLKPGDIVAILQSGAYGFSASPHGFLGHPPPLELLL